MDPTALLRAYDQQLRAEAEVADAPEVARLGPLHLATFPARRRGFITYPTLGGADVDTLIEQALAHYQADERVDEAEWKTRGHDAPADLLDRLAARGLEIEERETVMAGEASAAVAAAGPLPDGYTLHRAASAAEILAAEALAGRVFGDTPGRSARLGAELVERWEAQPDLIEMWFVRDATGEVVCSGRIDMVPGTEFAGLWGGACDAAHRGRGLYRALTAARARSALERGHRYLHSDCTEFSRPILQRAGLVAITTTTPATWHRRPA